ncbi:hypothetical protein KBB48_02815 [Candidatus Shapirobacteria bacterium]|nr:hypothetical protein [Candidatus Shapirobacteria bacterium]
MGQLCCQVDAKEYRLVVVEVTVLLFGKLILFLVVTLFHYLDLGRAYLILANVGINYKDILNLLQKKYLILF